MKKSTNLEGKSIRESRVVSEDKDKILMVSIDAGLGKNKPKKPITAKQRILNKISESLANEEAYEPSEIGSC
jgi:DhnA family fructose-bisphosphate aldolase class Ia